MFQLLQKDVEVAEVFIGSLTFYSSLPETEIHLYNMRRSLRCRDDLNEEVCQQTHYFCLNQGDCHSFSCEKAGKSFAMTKGNVVFTAKSESSFFRRHSVMFRDSDLRTIRLFIRASQKQKIHLYSMGRPLRCRDDLSEEVTNKPNTAA